MEFSEDALVLRVGTFREADCWVRFFSPSHGLLTGFAFGGRRSRRRFCGCLDPLSHVHFRVSLDRRREYYCLEEGTLINRFSEVKTDLKKLGMVSNCLRFFESLVFPPDGVAAAYALLREALEAANLAAEVSAFFPLLFRAKMTFSQGYQPSLNRCRGCGALLSGARRAVFSVQDGGFFCANCTGGTHGVQRVSEETLDLLDALACSGPRDWIAWNPPPHVREECLRLVDDFVQYHLGLSCNGNRFVRC